MDFGELRDLPVSAFAHAAFGWRRYAEKAADAEDRAISEVIGPLHRSAWAGPAASVAYRLIDDIDDMFAGRVRWAVLLRILLEEACEKFGGIQDALLEAVETASRAGLRIDALGRPYPPARGVASLAELMDMRAAASAYYAEIQRLQRQADELDQSIAAAISDLGPDGQRTWSQTDVGARAAALLGADPAEVPPSGTDPRRVAAWWRALTDEQRVLYTTAFPGLIARLDGVPAVNRDMANRSLLRAAPGEHGRPLLDRLERGEYADPLAPRLLLLSADTSAGSGRAIVAVGDPDHAAHTCVLVPGVNTTLEGMPGQIDRASRLQDAAVRASDGSLVSVVAWLDYGAPDIDDGAVDHHAAVAGAPLLDRFVDGLHATHDATPAHTSVLGHSYGSTVIGQAAQTGNGLAVDDIITAGSPGMDVDGVRDLNLDPHHVWAGAADDDPISGGLGSIWGVHGSEPSDPAFGANRFHVETSGHSGYWDPGSISLSNQARIIIGGYDRVTLDFGQLP